MSRKWEFPGGKVESNESFKAAITREIKEEFNWHVIESSNFGNWFFEYEDLCVNLHIMKLTLESNTRYENENEWTSHDKISWFDSIDNIELLGADKGAAIKALTTLKSK